MRNRGKTECFFIFDKERRKEFTISHVSFLLLISSYRLLFFVRYLFLKILKRANFLKRNLLAFSYCNCDFFTSIYQTAPIFLFIPFLYILSLRVPYTLHFFFIFDVNCIQSELKVDFFSHFILFFHSSIPIYYGNISLLHIN